MSETQEPMSAEPDLTAQTPQPEAAFEIPLAAAICAIAIVFGLRFVLALHKRRAQERDPARLARLDAGRRRAAERLSKNLSSSVSVDAMQAAFTAVAQDGTVTGDVAGDAVLFA